MSRTEQKASVRKILDARKSGFSHETERKHYIVGRDRISYDEDLPTFRGKTLSTLIEEKVAKGDDTINVLDIGCGEAIAIAQIMTRCPQVRGFGISAYDYRKDVRYVRRDDIDNIDYRVGDAQELARVYPNARFDFVVSRYCIPYVNDSLSVLRQAYSRTRTGGIILFDDMGTELTPKQALKLKTYWRVKGIHAEMEPNPIMSWGEFTQTHSLALQKTSNNKLPLPFRYENPLEGEISYRLDEVEVANTLVF